MKRIVGLKYALDKRDYDLKNKLMTCSPDFKNLDKFSTNENIEHKFNEIKQKERQIKDLKKDALRKMFFSKQRFK